MFNYILLKYLRMFYIISKIYYVTVYTFIVGLNIVLFKFILSYILNVTFFFIYFFFIRPSMCNYKIKRYERGNSALLKLRILLKSKRFVIHSFIEKKLLNYNSSSG